ncbi:taste receptor type 2 member 125-like [Thomomys bottae]
MEGDVSSLLAAVLGVFILGNVVNGFVALVNGVDLVKGRKISKVDQILTALALSRIGLLWSVVACVLLSFTRPDRVSTRILRMSNLSWVVSNHFSLWLSTNLSLVYFLKVAHFPSSVFRYLKWRLGKVVAATLAASLVLLVLNALLTDQYFKARVGSCWGNVSYFHCTKDSAWFSRVTLLTNSMFALVPFTCSLASFFLLTFSLWQHHRQMQKAALRARDASTTAHVRALHLGVAFLLLHLAFMLSLVLQLWTLEFLDRQLLTLLCLVTGIAFPSGHSLVLILGNSKLRRASGAALRGLWRRCGAPEPTWP